MGVTAILALLLTIGIVLLVIGFVNKKEELKKIGLGFCLVAILVLIVFTGIIYFGTENM